MRFILHELQRDGTITGQDLLSGIDSISDDVLEGLENLLANIRVLKRLQDTATIISKHPKNKALPNKRAVRVKNFLKFVFEKLTPTYAKQHKDAAERQDQLRRLDCNALKFSGLCFIVKEIIELPSADFNFLISNVQDFVRRQKLERHLYRDDINKAMDFNVDDDIEPEDGEEFKRLLSKNYELRLKRAWDEDEALPQRLTLQERSSESGQSKREIEFMFSKAPRDVIRSLPSPWAELMMTSEQWKMEDGSEGDETTEVMTVLMPKEDNVDMSMTIWMGRRPGIDAINQFKLQRTWTQAQSTHSRR